MFEDVFSVSFKRDGWDELLQSISDVVGGWRCCVCVKSKETALTLFLDPAALK
jgi:hypothetical protein